MKSWRKASLTVAMFSAAVLILAGCSSSSATKRVPNIYLPNSIQTMDPSVVTDTYSSRVIDNVEEGLTRSFNNKPELALAQSITTSKDGKTVTIKLRPNLKWSNGDKLTAQDFVYSWQRGVDPKTASQYAYLLAYIKNGTEINAGKQPVSSLGVKADSDTELTVQLAQPTPFFENLLGMSVYLPQDQKVVEKYGKSYGTTSDKMVYNGPFYFKSGASGKWNGTNNNYTIEKNPNYWDKKHVKSDSITFQVVKEPNTAVQLYKQGKLDLAPVGTPDLYNSYKDNKGFKNLPASQNEYLEFNQSGKGTSSPEAAKALQNLNIRRALVLATNRQGAIDAVSPANKPATGFTPKGTGSVDGKDFSMYAKQSEIKYDPKEAKKLFQQGLKELGLTSLTLNFETDSDSSTGKQFAAYFQKNFEKDLPGLTINQRLVPFQQRLKDSQNGNFDIVATLWGGDYSEPSTFLSLFVDGAGYNNGKFINPEYQAAMKKASTLPDVMNDKARYADYKAAEDALTKSASVDPVEFYSLPFLVNPKLKGISFNATGLDQNLKGAYIK